MTMSKVIETHESDENEEEEQVSDNEGENTNAGWADSVAKILRTNKPKGKKTLVLSKAKKLTDVRAKTKSAGFEVATADGEIKEEKIEVKEEEEEPLTKKRKKEVPSFRVKPNVLERDKERTLAKIATRGVVQLFNAVRNQQKDISKKLEEAGPLEVRKEKVLKSIDKKEFLNVLMGGKAKGNENARQSVTKTEESTWSVLRDDFMMGAKLKDWDKEVEAEESEEREVESE